MSIPTIIGPPAMPSFTGKLIPGKGRGKAPKISPRAIPANIAIRFGLSNRFSSSPNIFATLSIDAFSPTTVSLSPICKERSGDGSRSIPTRFMRVILIP